ncbi:MAG: octanoyl-[GcvH]:protein N-octanoyltransferase [Halobacteriales archaeon]|jgi:octanoyl-[GcvH]:protein N-octanoyltransferase
MRVLRGQAESMELDREVSESLRAWVGEHGEPAVRVWTPHRQVAFGRLDANEDGYEAARAAASDHGFPPVERDVGGRAVAYTGETTLAFARFEPIENLRNGLEDRYERMTVDVRRALRRLGVPAKRGEPPNAFCPGEHSLQRKGKLVGIAQRVGQGSAITSGICVVDDHEELAAVLDSVYDALGVDFDPESVGSVAKAGGTADPEVVRKTIEGALVGNAEQRVERVASFLDRDLRDT